jgi:23S rRNA (adenine2503-C2)-methyltransferase
VIPNGRKITLNFAVCDAYPIDPNILLRYFDPADYIVKLTPMHVTTSVESRGLHTSGDSTSMAPYEEKEAALRRAGYDVLVFIASKEEDESRITCGNAILADRKGEM